MVIFISLSVINVCLKISVAHFTRKLEAVQKAPDARRSKALSGGVLCCTLERKSRSCNTADGLF
ncbi:MAG TPA: hypothetical protein DCK87_07435 [Desulfotomaculum sp.]|nr:hypothetical protein [Desulfotomaculum sp.]